MLSSVVNSKRAIQINIQIMRAFTKLHEMLSTHEDLKKKIEAMEKKHDQQFQIVFEAIKQLRIRDGIRDVGAECVRTLCTYIPFTLYAPTSLLRVYYSRLEKTPGRRRAQAARRAATQTVAEMEFLELVKGF